MANPQKEEGYTAIANEIMDALCKIRIPGEEMQVLNAIFRKTYGWKKCEDAISLSQFADVTGINKPNVIRAIAGLLSKKIISVIEKDNTTVKVYKFNKDYEQWKPLSKKITLSKKIKTVIEKDNSSLSKKIPTKETTTKAKKTRADIFFPEWLPKETWEEYLEMRTRIKKPLLKKSFPRLWKELEKLKKKGNPVEEVLNQSIIGSWQGVFELKKSSKPSNEEIFRGAI